MSNNNRRFSQHLTPRCLTIIQSSIDFTNLNQIFHYYHIVASVRNLFTSDNIGRQIISLLKFITFWLINTIFVLFFISSYPGWKAFWFKFDTPIRDFKKKTCLLKARNFWLYILFEKRRIKKNHIGTLNQINTHASHVVILYLFFLFFFFFGKRTRLSKMFVAKWSSPVIKWCMHKNARPWHLVSF